MVEVNPQRIVSLRQPRGGEHFAPGSHCLVFTSDGKYISTRETCEEIHIILRR